MSQNICALGQYTTFVMGPDGLYGSWPFPFIHYSFSNNKVSAILLLAILAHPYQSLWKPVLLNFRQGLGFL
jgi:hypothetical protein